MFRKKEKNKLYTNTAIERKLIKCAYEFGFRNNEERQEFFESHCFRSGSALTERILDLLAHKKEQPEELKKIFNRVKDVRNNLALDFVLRFPETGAEVITNSRYLKTNCDYTARINLKEILPLFDRLSFEEVLQLSKNSLKHIQWYGFESYLKMEQQKQALVISNKKLSSIQYSNKASSHISRHHKTLTNIECESQSSHLKQVSSEHQFSNNLQLHHERNESVNHAITLEVEKTRFIQRFIEDNKWLISQHVPKRWTHGLDRKNSNILVKKIHDQLQSSKTGFFCIKKFVFADEIVNAIGYKIANNLFMNQLEFSRFCNLHEAHQQCWVEATISKLMNDDHSRLEVTFIPQTNTPTVSPQCLSKNSM